MGAVNICGLALTTTSHYGRETAVIQWLSMARWEGEIISQCRSSVLEADLKGNGSRIIIAK